MSMMVSFVLSFFPRDVLDEILNLIESVSEDFPSYSFIFSVIIMSIFRVKRGRVVDEDILSNATLNMDGKRIMQL